MGHSSPPPAADPPAERDTPPRLSDALQSALDEHAGWLTATEASGRACGQPPATFTGRQLAGKDLSNRDLRQARLTGAVMDGTDLSRTRLTGADLSGADLRRAKGLNSCQLAGTNLAQARLPERINFDKVLKTVHEASQSARPLMFGLLAACLYSVLTVSSTDDMGLLTNSSAEALPVIDAVVPVAWFLVLVPALLLAIFLYFHIYLQRLLESLAELPAVFPDGRPLDKQAHPWLLNGLVRSHYAVLRDEAPPPLSWLQNKLSMFLGWWVVPLTLGLFWYRYLSRHDWWGTGIQIFLLVVAFTSAADFHSLARITLRHGGCAPVRGWRWLVEGPRKWILAAAPVLAAGLWLFSDAAIYGHWPKHEEVVKLDESATGSREETLYLHEDGSESKTHTEDGSHPPPPEERILPPILGHLRQWLPRLLTPERLQTRALLSDRVALDAHLEGADLRHALMENAILSNGHFVGARLDHAVLRSANLRKADFETATLTGTHFDNAELQGANFFKADLVLASFLEARLANAALQGADASKANFYQADLRCANLSSSDLSDARVTLADLECAVLDRAVLVRTALEGADLKCADLRGIRLGPLDPYLPNPVKRAVRWQHALYSPELASQLGLEKGQAEKQYRECYPDPKKGCRICPAVESAGVTERTTEAPDEAESPSL